MIAHGLRNPFRLANRPGTNEMWISEVGWNDWEEINRVANPTDAVVENFGWPCYEGANGSSAHQGGYDGANLTVCENLYTANDNALGGGATSVLTAPFYAYHHGSKVVSGELCGTGSSSATGSAFYQGGDYPAEYDDAYFFADSSRQCIWTIHAGPDGVPDPASRTPARLAGVGPRRRRPDRARTATSSTPTSTTAGSCASSTSRWPFRRSPRSPRTRPAAARRSTSHSTRAGPPTRRRGAHLRVGRRRRRRLRRRTGPAPRTTSRSRAATWSRCASRRPRARSTTRSIVITVDNTPPTVEILSPSPVAALEGRRPDPLRGPRDRPAGRRPPAASQLEWSILIHHCDTLVDCHTHAVQDLPGISSGDFAAPDHEYPSYLEIQLAATDFGTGDWWNAGLDAAPAAHLRQRRVERGSRRLRRARRARPDEGRLRPDRAERLRSALRRRGRRDRAPVPDRHVERGRPLHGLAARAAHRRRLGVGSRLDVLRQRRRRRRRRTPPAPGPTTRRCGTSAARSPIRRERP